MYKLKEKYKIHMFKYAWTKLDLNGVYSKEVWNEHGFVTKVLEEVTN
jgi:hypothetical protein